MPKPADEGSLPASPPDVPATFESALTELETLVQQMESGKLDLEASLSAYQRGMALLGFCRDTLNRAERRVQVLEEGALREFPAAADGQ
jgi:exodeoxyribonuclease VII small subunit